MNKNEKVANLCSLITSFNERYQWKNKAIITTYRIAKELITKKELNSIREEVSKVLGVEIKFKPEADTLFILQYYISIQKYLRAVLEPCTLAKIEKYYLHLLIVRMSIENLNDGNIDKRVLNWDAKVEASRGLTEDRIELLKLDLITS